MRSSIFYYSKKWIKETVLSFLSKIKLNVQGYLKCRLWRLASPLKGPSNNFFFGKCFKKKLLNIFSKFLFLFESTIIPVNNGKWFHSNTHVVCVNYVYLSGRTYSLKSTSNDDFFFGKRFISKFIYSQSATVAQAIKEETIFSLKNIGSAKYLSFFWKML